MGYLKKNVCSVLEQNTIGFLYEWLQTHELGLDSDIPQLAFYQVGYARVVVTWKALRLMCSLYSQRNDFYVIW